ncbi:MAG: HDIG domain-containing protein [Candidatus Krumholzibacteria bacterium]|nr:HDIG domain-containing protein [Candidatus Krumholzibacteria bacterium]
MDRSLAWALGMGLVLLALHLVLFLPVPRISMDFPEFDQLADREINAPFSFEAPLLEYDVQQLKNIRVTEVPPVLVQMERGSGQPGNVRMELLFDALAEVIADTSADKEEKVGLLALQYPTVLPDQFLNLLAGAQPDSLVDRLERAWSNVMRQGVVDRLTASNSDRVVVLTAQAEIFRGKTEIIVQADLEERLFHELRSASLKPKTASLAASIMTPLISPNLIYNDDETKMRREAARKAVPKTREFRKGERIVDQSVRVTKQQVLYLEELQSLLVARGGGDDGPRRVSRFIVRGLLVAVTLGLFGWLALIHFPNRLRSLRFLIALALFVAVYLVGASFALSRPALGPLAVPVILLSLFATVLFKDRVGYTTTLLGVTLLAFLPQVGAGSIFTWYILGMVTVISVRRVQKRSQFYQAILLLTALSVSLVFLLGPDSFGSKGGGGYIYLVGLSSPMLLVMLGLFLLPVIEPPVGVCSDLTLLELSDLNHPLLKRMALEAQGTYHHSQVVGQLAEHAARAVDANALLTRVGALFHDIGKMEKPEYYVENQRPEFNKHDELSPSMSALVIAAHVKDGMELGRKWRLPRMVIDFIPEHHGTLVMEYFYHKAIEGEGNQTVKVDDFRYPGPKPQSRETGILMLADAVEAATRALAKPTPSRIREITKQIIDKRMLSGELDESGLTLSDLADIREAFIPLLTGIHHARIVYPGQKDRDGDRVPERRGERKAGL